MIETNISVNYEASKESNSSVWVRLEQANLPSNNGNINLDDVLRMNSLERARMSAFHYRADEDIYFSDDGNVINIPLLFLVFPSDPNLNYSLSIQEPGKISGKKRVNPQKVQEVIVPMANKVKMPYLINSAELEWETECYNEYGNIIPKPNYFIEKDTIYFDSTFFGVLRGKFTFVAYEYTATLSFTKFEDSKSYSDVRRLKTIISEKTLKITNIECTVLCKFLDEHKSEHIEKLELKIPKSVELFLESCAKAPNLPIIEWNDEKEHCHTTYYFSMCDGSIIDTVRKGSCNLFD